MERQLIIVADMEGASGIFERNAAVLRHGNREWYEEGRDLITSDVLAVCEAANEFGIEEMLIYDGHCAGEAKPNIKTEKLPGNARLFDVPDRRFLWRRIRGQAAQEPFGLITVGQHARYGEKNAYFPHTIQSPPIKNVVINGIHIAEIGQAVLSFQGVEYLANIGCQASMQEALELSERVVTIPVKDKSKNWEPDYTETHEIIKEGVLRALRNREQAGSVCLAGPYEFSMELTEGYYFEEPGRIAWKGDFDRRRAYWEAPSVEIGLEIFSYVRACLRENDDA